MRTTTALLLLAGLCAGTGLRAAPDDEFQCLIEPYRKIEIRSAVEALIETVHVQRGSVVRKGQRLVDLQSEVEKAALASAKYRAIMEGTVRSGEARVDYATDKLRRREALSQQSFVSSQDRDDAAAELRVAQADLLEARDNRQLSVLESKRLEELLRQRTLTSPFDGVVTEVEQHPGELAQTGEGRTPDPEDGADPPAARRGGAAGGAVQPDPHRRRRRDRGRGAGPGAPPRHGADRRQGGGLREWHLRRAPGVAQPERQHPGRRQVQGALSLRRRAARHRTR